MKKTKFLAVIVAVFVMLAGVLGACAKPSNYTILLNPDKSFTLSVGDKPDFTQYFIITDELGDRVAVTKDMLDLTRVDTSKAGSFPVTVSIGNASKTATFYVKEKTGEELDPDGNSFDAVAAKYADSATWNFAIDFTELYNGETYREYYEYRGNNVLNTYEYEGDTYTDYLGYNAATDTYYFYYDNGNNTYEKYAEGSSDFEDNFAYMSLVYPSELGNFAFTEGDGKYTANSPASAGNAILGEYDGYAWISLEVYIANGKLAKIVGVMDDNDTRIFEFSKHGQIKFTLPDANPDEDTEPDGIMGKQTYDPATFDNETLQDKMLRHDGGIGLPSTGNVNALVIPVQFSGDTITAAQLANLNIAFNGTAAETGWESVHSYYLKASYGKLNLTFDIQDVYRAKYNASHYESSTQVDGSEAVLLEVLSYYESRLDLTDYDFNGDGMIDAVYLIYSAPVDYDNGDFFWAYTTWYYGDNTYDGLDTYYYFFAGFDFMDESTSRDTSGYYDLIPGLKVNASTYIHETGHLLGLDDYYDYDTDKGCNEGLGSADMMDYTVGDHNVYSKIMLGWLTPTIVNETATLTIEASCTSASAILIPLNFNNSYFCEYLLIDLYAAQGLNQMHASMNNSYLYDGADYGVRIYHVSSSINKPYGDDYGSFTDYNNSLTNYALLKLVEADGEKKFSGSGGYASSADLWQAGNQLSKAFSSYTRNDGKLVNFDIKINSVSATSASITVTFH